MGAGLMALGAAVVVFASGRAPGRLPAVPRRLVGVAAALGAVAAVPFGGLAQLSIAREYSVQSDAFWTGVGQHLALAGAGVALGALIGVPLGILAFHNATVRRVALGVVGVIQTVPSLALLGLLVAPLAALRAASPPLAALGVSGIGPTPAVIALTLYALLPIVRNTYVGLSGVDPAAIDAGRGMGMSGRQLLLRVELPLALPLLLEGLRSAAVLVLGIATVTAFVGAGGLGVLVFTGLGQQADDLVLLGAIPIILLAVAADLGVRGLSRLSVSPGIRGTA
jgi:osmoprotectant transport system permease protein